MDSGLPYAVSNIIDNEAKLLVASPQKFQSWFNVQVLGRAAASRGMCPSDCELQTCDSRQAQH